MGKVEEFLKVEKGYGYGDGYGDGDGYGSGSGSGSGYGDGYGDVYGGGIKRFNGVNIHIVDGIQTAIVHVKDQVAKGFILNKDFTTEPCYIVKRDNLFAHGKTIQEAMQSLMDKLFDDMPEEERIEKFIEHFADMSKKYPASEFFSWHHYLTGSCDQGRRSFARNRGINLETDEFTVMEFIELTENDYNSKLIRELKKKVTYDENKT